MLLFAGASGNSRTDDERGVGGLPAVHGISGDVEAADFVDGNKNADSMFGHSYRLTSYFNKYDEALQISNVERAGVEPRVGRVGLPLNAPAKAVDIDCSAH